MAKDKIPTLEERKAQAAKASANKPKPAPVATTTPVATTPTTSTLPSLEHGEPVNPTVVKLRAEVDALKLAVKAKQAELDKAMGKTPAKPTKMSLVLAAVEVLGKAGKAGMKCDAIVAKAAELGLWESPNGLTPGATLYAALITEVNKKGTASRFTKVDKGTFALRS